MNVVPIWKNILKRNKQYSMFIRAFFIYEVRLTVELR